MSKIIKIYQENIPSLRFIGKKYSNNDRKNGNYSHLWKEWFESDNNIKISSNIINFNLEDYNEINIGLCRANNDGQFEYWIGMFAPVNTIIPNGFESIVFNNTKVMTFYIKGKEPDIYKQEDRCLQILKQQGYSIKNINGYQITYERYIPSRFSEDVDNDRIIDICLIIE